MRVRYLRSWRTSASIGLAVLGSFATEPAGAVAPDDGFGNGMLTGSVAPTEPTVPSGPGAEPSPAAPFSPADRERRLAEQGLTAGQSGDDPHLQAGFGARAVDCAGGSLRALQHVSHLLLVGWSGAENARGRQAGARGVLQRRPKAALSEGAAPALL